MEPNESVHQKEISPSYRNSYRYKLINSFINF